MGTKKGMRRKTARRAYEPKRTRIRKTTYGGEPALQITEPGKVFGTVFVPKKDSFFGRLMRK